MLYRAETFEPLTETPWEESAVRSAVAAIGADAERAYSAEGLWPADEWDAWTCPAPLKNLYVGAAGVVWALSALRGRGLVEGGLDLAAAARRAWEAWRAEPDFPAGEQLPSPAESSLLCGETGALLVAWRLEPDGVLADLLLERVRANVRNDAWELMWGSPGTLLAAGLMHEWTGEQRWADAWQESARILLDARDADGLWTQHLYGGEVRSLGAPHGLVGNVGALLRGPLAGERRTELVDGTVALLERFAIREGDLVSWPGAAGAGIAWRDGEIRLQWCGGAPGVAIAAGGYLPDELLLGAASTVWAAGPHGLEKGPGICHGTAGNGYALLRAFARTGDESWLERARRFAVHALEQVERLRASRGRGRYALWTGDVGVALFAADCLEGRAEYPLLEAWE